MGNNFNPELSDKYKLTGSNYIDWKQRICSLLLIRGYYDMVTGQESPDKCAEQEKIDPKILFDGARTLFKDELNRNETMLR